MSNLRGRTWRNYNRASKYLEPFKIGSQVLIQNNRSGKWIAEGIIVGIGQNRDYLVKLPSGKNFWRNRRFLTASAEDNYKEK